VRAFTSADIVQHADGADAFTINPTLALTNPSTDGSGGIIILAAQSPLTPPDQWHAAAQAGIGGALLSIMCRADLPAGETTWPFTTLAGSANWAWVVEEWTNLSYSPIETSASTGLSTSVTNPAAISTGTTDVFSTEYVVGVAAILLNAGAGSSAWSAVTWSNGFTETDVVSLGTGTTNGDMQMRVARLYGTSGDAGSWETTCTFTGGTQTGKTGHGALAVFRAEDQVEVPSTSTSVLVG
jgi:hypothetical protein